MKKKYFLALIIFIFSNIHIIYAQGVIGHALIRVFDKHIPLYDRSHKVIDTIMCSVKNDLLYSVSILKIKNNFAHINAYCFVDDVEIEKIGWIQLEYLVINPSCNELILRKKPFNRAKSQCIIKNAEWGDLYPIKKAYKGWLYIEIYIGNKHYSGWMSPEQQCTNPYSPCC